MAARVAAQAAARVGAPRGRPGPGVRLGGRPGSGGQEAGLGWTRLCCARLRWAGLAGLGWASLAELGWAGPGWQSKAIRPVRLNGPFWNA